MSLSDVTKHLSVKQLSDPGSQKSLEIVTNIHPFLLITHVLNTLIGSGFCHYDVTKGDIIGHLNINF